MPDFKQIIKDKLKQRNMSISKLSRIADVPPGSLFRYLSKDNVSINSRTLEKVLNVLDL